MPESVIGRVGSWCFHRQWWVLAAWAFAVAAGIVATGPLFDRLTDSRLPRSVESLAGNDILNAGNDSAGTVVGVLDRVDRSKPQVRDTVTAAALRLGRLPGVRAVEQPFDQSIAASESASMVSNDGLAIIISVKLAALDRSARDAAALAITGELHGLVADLPPGATVEVGGAPVLSQQTRGAVKEDLQRAEFSSLPVTLIVLVLVFGGVVAAGLPVIAAAVSVAAAMGLMLVFSAFTDVDQDGVTVVTLLGLGLSVDYGLLLVARYREELLGGHPPELALARAWATAGRTILFSALTVAAALTGLLMFDLPALSALGAAGVSIAIVSMLVSLTLTAALIGMLRRWIRPSKHHRRLALQAIGAAGRSGRFEAHHRYVPEDEPGFFSRLSGMVQRRPVPVLVATAVILLAAGVPLFSTELRLPGLEGVPRTVEAARVADTLADRFDLPAAPAVTVVARMDATVLDAWADRWQADPGIAKIWPVRTVRSTSADPLSTVSFDVTGDRQGPQARDLVQRLREDRPGHVQSWITGDAAVLTDLMERITAGLPAAIIVTLLAMLTLLFAMTGSLVVPAKAIIANLVSLGATFGILTAVFGYGWGSGLLDTLTVGSLNPFVVVVIFAFAFGLSMDYEVFLLARIKEHVDAGVDTETAVRRGLQHSGRVITSAALLMVIVFGSFAAARVGNVEQIGLGLTVAVLIDATVVRCLLVPATMTLLGQWNWWAPPWLARLYERSARPQGWLRWRGRPLPSRRAAPDTGRAGSLPTPAPNDAGRSRSSQ